MVLNRVLYFSKNQVTSRVTRDFCLSTKRPWRSSIWLKELEGFDYDPLGLDTRDKACYNLRKRYGRDVARTIINFWNHFHIDSSRGADEALLYYLEMTN